MKYFGYMPNDFVNGEGVCVSLWTAGCPHHCEGCHNPHMWEYNNGSEVPANLNEQLIAAIKRNGIIRNFSILGGEPLMHANLALVSSAIQAVRAAYPNIKIFLWTGYTLQWLTEERKHNKLIDNVLNNIDVLIDGPFILAQRDITLKMRGSSNQLILYKNIDF